MDRCRPWSAVPRSSVYPTTRTLPRPLRANSLATCRMRARAPGRRFALSLPNRTVASIRALAPRRVPSTITVPSSEETPVCRSTLGASRSFTGPGLVSAHAGATPVTRSRLSAAAPTATKAGALSGLDERDIGDGAELRDLDADGGQFGRRGGEDHRDPHRVGLIQSFVVRGAGAD